jgi:hypothetical protein
MSNHTHTSTQELADPLVHSRAVGASAIIGVSAGAAVGLLWIAAAFSSHDTWAYSHLAWWLGATVIGAVAIAGVIAGGLSSTRGALAGAANGLTSAATVVAAVGGLALVALAVNGSFDQTLVYNGHSITVEFLRPYVAFWSAAAGIVLAGVGGAAGGLLPRRHATHPVVELSTISTIRPESVVASNGSTVPVASGF